MSIWDALSLLVANRVLFPPKAPMPLLKRMAALGWCYQSGQLFHALPECDRVAVAVAPPQRELFA